MSESYFGQTLSIHLNSDQEQAVAFLTNPEPAAAGESKNAKKMFQEFFEIQEDQGHWQWRNYMAQQIAETLDMKALSVKGVYLFGSTNTGDAGMGSDIDLLIHVDKQNDTQRLKLESWIDGWSRALAKLNYLHTGYVMDKLLDVHIVTDKDIQDGNSFAIKSNSVLDPATPLRVL